MKTLELILDEDTAFQPLDYVLKKHLGLTKRQISQAKFRASVWMSRIIPTESE